VIVVAAAVAASRNSTQQDVLFNKVGVLRTDSQQLQIALLNEETGIAGTPSAAPRGPPPYDEGLASEPGDDRGPGGARRRVPGRPVDLTGVQAQIADWHRYVAQPVIDAIARGDRAAALDELDDSSRERFDAVRGAIATLAADVTVLRDGFGERGPAVDPGDGLVASSPPCGSSCWPPGAGDPVAPYGHQAHRPAGRRGAPGGLGRLQPHGRAGRAAGAGRARRRLDEMRRRIVADLRVGTGASDEVDRANRQLERQTEDLRRVERGPGAVRLRGVARPAGAAAQGGELLPAPPTPVRRPARRARRSVHLVRRRRRAPDAAPDQRPAGVLPDRPGHRAGTATST